MGFLGKLFGSKPTFEDRAWLTRELALDDLVRRARADAADESLDCLVVYHFPDTREVLESKLGSQCELLSRPGTEVFDDLRARAGSSSLLLASEEIPEDIKRGRGTRGRASAGRACHVHLAEHYPIPYRDDHVLNLHSTLPAESQFVCYVGLDEAWLAAHLGDSVLPLLERLGLSDDEPLVHSMIGSSLRRAQEQLANKQRGIEHSAHSSAEWMSRNIPN